MIISELDIESGWFPTDLRFVIYNMCRVERRFLENQLQ